MPDSPRTELISGVLREVSRSFYLTLRILPSPVRTPIGLAYLLARTTDTVADTEIVPASERLRILQEVQAAIRSACLERVENAPSLRELIRPQGLPAERVLLARFSDTLTLLRGLPADDRQRIGEVLAVITSGQELDLNRFAFLQPGEVKALALDSEADDYTWRVAGCVGEFWTKTCRARLFPRAQLDDAWFLQRGVRFGKGLQWVNILRDLPRDLRTGRCYLPIERLKTVGLKPADLLSPEVEPKLRPIYHEYLDVALDHLRAGWEYTNALPRSQIRIRLACAWPILIGAQTLARLREVNPLDDRQRIKIRRSAVRAIILRSILLYPWPSAWRKLFV